MYIHIYTYCVCFFETQFLKGFRVQKGRVGAQCAMFVDFGCFLYFDVTKLLNI